MPNEIRVSVNIDLAAAYANWLNRVPWQLFCTLTFAHPVSDQQGNRRTTNSSSDYLCKGRRKTFLRVRNAR
jgi:hypothetical protein